MPSSMSLIPCCINGLTPQRDSSILPEDLATQGMRLKEEQLRKEEEKVRVFVQITLLSHRVAP